MKQELAIGEPCNLLVKLPYLSPTLSEFVYKVLIVPSFLSPLVPTYARSLLEMTECVWWRVGFFISICFFLRFSHAARTQPQALLAQQAQQTNHDRLGAVASENKICSQIGIDLLEAGGNAADAVGSQNYSSYETLTIRTVCGNDPVHRRGWSASCPRIQSNRAERI